MTYSAWRWFCWKVCNHWWPFGFGRIAKPVYFWFLPWSGDHVIETTNAEIAESANDKG